MHLLSLTDLSPAALQQIVERSCKLAAEFQTGKLEQSLSDNRVALIVDDGGWRNTTAADLGVQLLGATCVTVPISLRGNEEIEDLARYLSNWFQLVAIRSPSLSDIERLADASDVPVVNLRTRTNHPCETLGDLSFIQSKRGSIEELSVVAVAPADNILHSWAEAAATIPLKLTQVSPAEYWIDRTRYPQAEIVCVENLAALTNADVIVTDCWPAEIELERVRRLQITSEVLDNTKEACLFIPCPPVTRGSEVSDDAMAHDKCVVYQAKSHLMYAQNALFEYLLRLP